MSCHNVANCRSFVLFLLRIRHSKEVRLTIDTKTPGMGEQCGPNDPSAYGDFQAVQRELKEFGLENLILFTFCKRLSAVQTS